MINEKLLREKVKNGASIRQLAKDFGVAKSVIWRFLKKNDIKTKNTEVIRKKLDENELRNLVELGLSHREISVRMKVGLHKVRTSLENIGLKTLNKRNVFSNWVCSKCGDNNKEHFYKDRKRAFMCIECSKRANRIFYKKIKKELVEYKGGKCEICGYNKCLGSMSFHHESDKDPNWQCLRRRPLKEIKKELDKCRLLCVNCHQEIHWIDDEID